MKGSSAKLRFLCVLLCFILLVPLSVAAHGLLVLNEVKESPFSDITPRTPLAEAFAILKVRDIFRGYPDGTVGPDENLNRAQFAAVAVRTLARHAEADVRAGVQPATPDGAEVPNWAWGWMNAALYLGLIRGYPDGTIGPNRNITFEEALMILLRATGYEPYLVGDWPHKVFDKARELGLDQGVVVIPGQPIKRWEMAVLAANALSLKKADATGHPTNPCLLEEQGAEFSNKVTAVSGLATLTTPDHGELLFAGEIYIFGEATTVPELVNKVVHGIKTPDGKVGYCDASVVLEPGTFVPIGRVIVFPGWRGLIPPAEPEDPELALAKHWAPDFYQILNPSIGSRFDLFTRFDFDGDKKNNNNWEAAATQPLPGYASYSVVETNTHYFVGYWLYHPRRQAGTPTLSLEGHMNGAVLTVRKDGTTYGRCEWVSTTLMREFRDYAATSVRWRDSHPLLAVNANQASFTPDSPGPHSVVVWAGAAPPSGFDGIVYQCGTSADVPGALTGAWTNRYTYALLSFREIWDLRNDIGDGKAFGRFGYFDGNNGVADSGKAPWVLDDSDDGPTYAGDILSDPAHYLDVRREGLGTFSHAYTKHPYYTHEIAVAAVMSRVDKDTGVGARSDVYVGINSLAHPPTTPWLSSAQLWKRTDATRMLFVPVTWGRDQAEFAGTFTEPYRSRYFTRHRGTVVYVAIFDRDTSPDADDFMGYVSTVLMPGTSRSWSGAPTSTGEALVSGMVKCVQ